MSQAFQIRMSQIAQLGDLSRNEAGRIVHEVYRDGIVERSEAEALFRLNAKLDEPGPMWTDRFVEAIKDFLLEREAPIGWVTEEETAWLISQIGASEKAPSESEIDLMLAVLRYSEGAPQSLSDFCLEAISGRIIENGHADEAMAERMRRILHAPGGDGSVSITRHEASILFRTNDAIADVLNAKSWDNVFAKAIINHLLTAAHPDPSSEECALTREAWLKDTDTNIAVFIGRMAEAFTSGKWFDRISYSEESAARARHHAAEIARRGGVRVTREEQQWFLKRLGWDRSVSAAEQRLVDLLNEEAPAFAAGLSEALREDGLDMPA